MNSERERGMSIRRTGAIMALGAAFGLLFGMLLNNTPFGIILSVAIGLLVGALVDILSKRAQ